MVDESFECIGFAGEHGARQFGFGWLIHALILTCWRGGEGLGAISAAAGPPRRAGARNSQRAAGERVVYSKVRGSYPRAHSSVG